MYTAAINELVLHCKSGVIKHFHAYLYELPVLRAHLHKKVIFEGSDRTSAVYQRLKDRWFRLKGGQAIHQDHLHECNEIFKVVDVVTVPIDAKEIVKELALDKGSSPKQTLHVLVECRQCRGVL